MRLEGENPKPHVERRDERDGSQNILRSHGVGTEKSLNQDERTGQHCKNKPDVEVQEQVPDIEGPGLSAKDLRASALTAENVVRDDIPGHKDNLPEEGVVDCHLEGLENVSARQWSQMNRICLPI